MKHQVIAKLATLSALAVGMFLFSSSASAVLLDTRSNYMGSDWSGNWNTLANWSAVTPYSAEPFPGSGENAGNDIHQISIAHDDTYAYLYINQNTQHEFSVGGHMFFFDTDLNAATGAQTNYWWGGDLTVGAEVVTNGAFLVDSTNNVFGSVDNWVDAGFGDPGDVAIQIARPKLGNPAAFDWEFHLFGGHAGDYYPNPPLNHRYVVPEPASLAVVGLAGFALLGRRRSSSRRRCVNAEGCA